MVTKLKKVVFLSCLLLSVYTQAATTVTVKVLKNGEVVQQGMAALVAEETLVINNLLVLQGDQFQVQDVDSDALFVGTVSVFSESSDLALISVKGLKGEPHILAKDSFASGRKMSLSLVGGKREGTIHSILPIESGNSFLRVQHTVLVLEDEYGAPILNNCNELAGVSQNKKRGLFNSRLLPSDTFGISTGLDNLRLFLDDNNVTYSVSEDVCLSEKEQITKLAEEKKKQQEDIEKAEQASLEKEQEINKLEKENAEKGAALEEAEKEKLENEQELLEAEEKKIEQENELKRVEEEKAEQAEKLVEIEQRRVEDDAKQQAEEKRIFYIRIGMAVGFAIFSLLILGVLVKRRKQLQSVNQRSESVENELSAEKAKLESSQEELKQASARFNDILFVGKDEGGVEHRVKLVGNVLARSPEGVIFGRSVNSAKFVLNVPGISREHFKLGLVNGEVTIEDLGSFNGTALNGKTLAKGQIETMKNGDELRIGTVVGRVHYLD